MWEFDRNCRFIAFFLFQPFSELGLFGKAKEEGRREEKKGPEANFYFVIPATSSLPHYLVSQPVEEEEEEEEEEKQEQTEFYDLRRGITEGFQGLAKFQRTLSKSTKKSPI